MFPAGTPRSHWFAAQSQSYGRRQQPDNRLEVWLASMAVGDEEAFKALYEVMAPRLFGLILRVLRSRDLAQEVCQEVLMTIWCQADRFDPGRGSATAWMMTIAHRRAVDRVRSVQSRKERDRLCSIVGSVPHLNSTAQAIEARTQSARIQRALQDLPSDNGLVLRLAYFEGLTHAEIADALGLPLGTAETRIRNGLRQLHRRLPPDS